MHESLVEQLTAATGARLRPSNAVAALLLHEDGRYIMQLRDANARIFYPAHWGCFGGAVEPGEEPLQALRRELQEEIELVAGNLRRFTQFDFDFSPLGYPKVYRLYYEMEVPEDLFGRLVLHEGAALRAFEGMDLLSSQKVTPYDSFAIWMHMYHRRRA